MTDIERMRKYEEIKQRVLDQLLGPGTPYPVTSASIPPRKSKCWNSKKSWYEQPRIVKDMNADTHWLLSYYYEARKNNGKIVRYIIEEGAEPEKEDK